MKKQISLIISFLLLSRLFLLSVAAQESPQKSLYERLGGVYAVAAVIDDFVEKLLSDPKITANQNVVKAMEHITKPGLKYLLTEMVCQASGGPQKYSGRSMKEAHQGLNISEDEWNAMLQDLLAALTVFKVPEKEQRELIVIVWSTKPDIVTAKPQEVPKAAPQLAPPKEPNPIPQAAPKALEAAPASQAASPSPKATPETPQAPPQIEAAPEVPQAAPAQ